MPIQHTEKNAIFHNDVTLPICIRRAAETIELARKYTIFKLKFKKNGCTVLLSDDVPFPGQLLPLRPSRDQAPVRTSQQPSQ